MGVFVNAYTFYNTSIYALCFELFGLMGLNILILIIGVGKYELTYHIGSTGFAINTTIIPGSKLIKGGKFKVDPLELCKVETGCPQLFQSRFRFQWLQGAADVMVNGISKQLS
ncbi:14205_t:CDS:2, partial [Funneliformis caledonium]